MRRPLAIVGFTYLATLVAASFFGSAVDAALAVLFVLCAAVAYFALSFFRLRAQAALAFCAAAVALAALSAADVFWYQPVTALASREATVTGALLGPAQQSYGKYYYTVKTAYLDIDGGRRPFSATIRLALAKPLNARPCDTVSAPVRFYLPSDNYGSGYSSRSYYKSRGIYLFATATGAVTVIRNNSPPPLYYAWVLRQNILSSLYGSIFGQPGALAAGILIGDTSRISNATVSNFRTTGISHLLAVSGTQTSLLARYLLLLLLFLRVPKRLGCLLSMAGVGVFMAVTGFSASVSRAGIMSILFLAALAVRREADPLTSLALSALVLCLLNPFAAMDVGLLLSFSATLGLVTISSPLSARLKKACGTLPARVRPLVQGPASVLCETVGASLLTFPVIMLTFGQISLVALVTNLVEVPVSFAVTLFTALIALLYPLKILFFLTVPLGWAASACCSFMAWFAAVLAALPFASVSSAYGFLNLFLLCCACLAGLYFAFRGKGAHPGVCLSCCGLVLSVGLLSFTIAAKGVLAVAALPVGYTGQCTVVTKDRRAAVIGLAGNSPEVKVQNYLKACNIRGIEVLVLTAYSRESVDSANALLKSVPCGKIYCAPGYNTEKNAWLTPVSRQTRASVLGGVALTLLPQGDALSARVEYGASRVGILASVPDSAALAALQDADTLVFNCSLPYADAKSIAPARAVAGSSAAALYSVANLELAGCTVYETSRSGTVSLLTRGNGGYLVKTGG